jgi:hypothetical protein
MPLPVFIVELPYRIGQKRTAVGKNMQKAVLSAFFIIVKEIKFVLDCTKTTGAICKCLFAK